MTLGFTVADLLPRAVGGMRMGLSRVAEADWLWPGVDRAARARALAAEVDAVQILPEAEAAGREVAAMVAVAGGLADAACATHEDLCLVAVRPGGVPVLVGGAVGYPTDWRLADKIGLPLAQVHAPIHGYAEQLSAGVDHFFRTLEPGPIFGRANWFVVPTDALRYLPADDPAARFVHVTADNAGRELFVRCERQTLRRLPQTGAVLFTIGIAVARLDMLPAGQVAQLAAALDRLGAGEHERRAAPGYASALEAYAACRAGQRTA